MDEARKKVSIKRIYLAFTGSALAVYFCLMVFVLPWWHVSSHPVVLNLGAGAAQDVQLAYSGSENPLPLVPLGDAKGYHWEWGTELPARPHYDLALVFPQGTVGEVVLKGMKVIRSVPAEATYSLIRSSLVEPEDGLVRIRKTTTGYRILAEPGGVLPVSVDMPTITPYSWLVVWFKVTVGYLITALVLLLTLVTFLRFPNGVRAFQKKTPAPEVLILLMCAIGGAFIHFYLVSQSMPAFTPGDSDALLIQAVGTHTNGTLLPSQGLAPGYPFLLREVAQWTDWDLSNQINVQAVLFSVSVLLLGLSMVRLVQGYILGPFLILILVSPSAIWASRHIGVESASLTAWCTAIAAFIFFLQRDGILRWLGIVLFGILAVWATAISSMGLVLYVLPAALLVGTLWWTSANRTQEFWKMSVFWRSLIQSLFPFAILILSSVYFGGGATGNPSILSLPRQPVDAPFTSGLFEVSGLVGSPAYAAVINERVNNDYAFDEAAMKNYPGLAAASYAELPLQGKLLAWGRLSAWGLFLPDIQTFAQRPLKIDYEIRTHFKNDAVAEKIRDGISEVMRETGTIMHVKETHSNPQLILYNDSVLPIYAWFYRILFLGAIIGWMLGLSERKYLAAVLVLPFLLNVFLHVFLWNVTSGSIQSLDVFLWLGAVAGLVGVDPKAMQKQTDVADRRSFAPIRPKRLMTRYQDLPGTQGLPLDH